MRNALTHAFEESDSPRRLDIIDWVRTGDEFRRIIECDEIVVQTARPTNVE